MRSRTSTCKNKRRWKLNVLQIYEVSMNIKVEFWSVFFFISIQSENFRKSFRNRRVSTVQIPLKLYGNQSQWMNLDLMFSMKPVNITFILPNNFNRFLSVLETFLTIPRYEKHFIVNPRCLIMISLFWNTNYLVHKICNMFRDDIRMALNCMLKMFQIDKYWCVECNPLIKTRVSDPIIHTSKVKIKGVSKGSWCYHHKFKCHKNNENMLRSNWIIFIHYFWGKARGAAVVRSIH